MSEKNDILEQTILRIEKMEKIFDHLQKLVLENPKVIQQDASVKEMLEILVEYYDSKQWMREYEMDERGELPANLKRGVLSQDGVYNFLTEL